MKKQKGFIQIPILFVIIAGVLVLGVGGYFGTKQYENYQYEKVEQEKIRQEKEKEAQALTEAQQKALKQAQIEIEKLKQEGEVAKQKQNSLESAIKKEQQKPKNTSISASELTPYLSGIVQLDCGTEFGSGSLWKLPGIVNAGIVYGILTNKHVVNNPSGIRDNSGNSSCVVRVRDEDGLADEGMYDLDFTNWYKWNNSSDISFQKIEVNSFMENQGDDFWSTPIEKLNFAISALRKCPTKMAVNSPVVIVVK